MKCHSILGLAFKTHQDLMPAYFLALFSQASSLSLPSPPCRFYPCISGAFSSHLHKYKLSFQITFRTKSFSSSPPQSSLPPLNCHSTLSLSLLGPDDFLFHYVDNVQSPSRHLSCVLHLCIPHLPEHLPLKCPIDTSNSFPKSDSLSFPQNLSSSCDLTLIKGTTKHSVSSQL